MLDGTPRRRNPSRIPQLRRERRPVAQPLEGDVASRSLAALRVLLVKSAAEGAVRPCVDLLPSTMLLT